MANLRELNQPNPFWEWVSDIEKQSREGSRNGDGGPSQRTTPGNEEKTPQQDKETPDRAQPDWDEKMPPPPPEFDGPPPPEFEDPPSPPPPPGFDGPSGPPPPPNHHHHPHPGRGRGRGFHRGGHGHHRGGHHGGWGGWGGFGGWGESMFNGPFGERHERHGKFRRDREAFRDLFEKGLFNSERGGCDMSNLGPFLRSLGINFGNYHNPTDDKDFSPAIDVFDTPQAYYVHLSLAGAKKQDLDVSWDAENFQVIVSGIIHRVGDEEFLKTLAVNERQIGLFERKIKLGSKSDPVSVDADAISAKMEDGVLMIKVPKHEEFIEIKKVNIA